MNRPDILIAGLGNIFLGDDAFGVEVVRKLAGRPLPDGVRVVDFGIRGLDLAYALLDGCATAILVDATPRGDPPGTLYVLDLEGAAGNESPEAVPPVEAHSLDPAKVLRLVAALGGWVGRVLLVGCEPSPPGAVEEMCQGLSAPVRTAVDEAVPLIEALVARLRRGEPLAAGTGPAEDNLTLEQEVQRCQRSKEPTR